MPYSRITRTAYGADAIRYARGYGKGHDGSERRYLYSAGVNMLADRSVRFEEQMRPFWDRMDARHKIQVDRCVVSFSTNELDPDDEADQLTALEIGCRIAKTNAPDCQSAVFVHADGKGHKLHLHILTNDVRMSDHKGIDPKEAYPDADAEWEDQLYDRFVRWRNTHRKKWQERGQVFPPVYRKTESGEGRIVERDLDRQYRVFLDEWKKTEAAKELRVQG